MTKEVLQTAIAFLRNTGIVPPIVFTVLDIASKVDTPEKFWGQINQAIANSPATGETE